LSALAVAQTAYAAIRKGFQVGKEVESMAGDLGRWMGAIHTVKHSHEKAKKRKFGSVEEEALETFAAKKKAEAMENELRNFINMNYGPSAWQEVIRVQAELRKQRAQEIERARKQGRSNPLDFNDIGNSIDKWYTDIDFMGGDKWHLKNLKEVSKHGASRSGEPKVVNHPPKGQKQRESVIFRHQLLKPSRLRNTRPPPVLNAKQLRLVSNTPNSLKRYEIKRERTER